MVSFANKHHYIGTNTFGEVPNYLQIISRGATNLYEVPVEWELELQVDREVQIVPVRQLTAVGVVERNIIPNATKLALGVEFA